MKSVLLIAMFSLAACSPGAEAEEPVVTETPVAQAATGIMAADGRPPEGTYEITLQDGSVKTQTLNADGTYTDTDSVGIVTPGTWRQERPDYVCFQLDDAPAPTCYNETVDADGTWRSIDENDPTDVSTVVRLN